MKGKGTQEAQETQERNSPLVPLVLLVFLSLFPVSALGQTADTIFQSRCAQCHSAGNAVGAPAPEMLRQMTWQTILTALETGKMKGIGDTLSAVERDSIAKYLGTTESQKMPASAKCASPPQHRATPEWNGWADAANTRFQPTRQAGLTRDTTAKL